MEDELLKQLKTINAKKVNLAFEKTCRYLVGDITEDDFIDIYILRIDKDRNELHVDFLNTSLLVDIVTILSDNIDSLMITKVANILIMKNGMPMVLFKCLNGGNKQLIIDLGLIYNELLDKSDKSDNKCESNSVYKYVLGAIAGVAFMSVVNKKNSHCI